MACVVALLLVLTEVETLRYSVVDEVLGVLAVLVTDAGVEAVKQFDNWFLGLVRSFRLLFSLLLVLGIGDLLLLLFLLGRFVAEGVVVDEVAVLQDELGLLVEGGEEHDVRLGVKLAFELV